MFSKSNQITVIQRRGRDRMVVGFTVPITTTVVSSNPAHSEMYSIHYLIELSVAGERSVVFYGYYDFLHQ